jgi:hypothetical protein
MTDPRLVRCGVAGALAVLLCVAFSARAQQPEARRPLLSVRVTPPVGFTPLRVRAAAELRDGNDDYAEFYCATVEWDWGDGTMSENSSDCDPYEAGKSTIQRRFSAEHVYRQGGAFRIFFRLKQKTKQVAAAGTNVTVRSGAGEGFGR